MIFDIWSIGKCKIPNILEFSAALLDAILKNHYSGGGVSNFDKDSRFGATFNREAFLAIWGG